MAVTSWIRRQFKNGVITTATTTMTSGATTFTVNAGAGATFPDGSIGPFIVTVDQGNAAEEKILVTSRSTDTFTVAASGRGYNGTTASAHTGAFVLHTLDAQDLDEANQVASQTLGLVAASGDLLVGSAANTLVKLARGSNGQWLQTGASTLSWQSTLTNVGDDAAWNAVLGGIGFSNSWVNLGGSSPGAGYRKLLGRIYLRGAIQSGTNASTAFTLPAGYRPSAGLFFTASNQNASQPPLNTVAITSAGLVQVTYGSGNSLTDLAGISFDTL